VVPGPDNAVITWGAPPAGDSFAGYEVQLATNAGFTTGLQTFSSPSSWATTRTVTGLVPATSYWTRVRVLSASTGAGWGAWSGATAFQTLSGAKVLTAGAWKDGVAYARVNGAWVLTKVWKRVNGAWVL
jgi:hypothetical protein